MDELFVWLAKQLTTGQLGVTVVLAIGWAYAEFGRARDRTDAIANRKAYQDEAQLRIKANETLSKSIDAIALAIARMEGSIGAQRAMQADHAPYVKSQRRRATDVPPE